MNTVRVNVCYRPLRICWAVASGDFTALHDAVATNFALWGGRFNPIVSIDDAKLADSVVDVFRPDWVVPIGKNEGVNLFAKRYLHLASPLFSEEIFTKHDDGDNRATVLDIYNLMVHLKHKPALDELRKRKPRIYEWDELDDLRTVFLMMFGKFPQHQKTGVDYLRLYEDTMHATKYKLERNGSLPPDFIDHPTISAFSRFGMQAHYQIRNLREHHGFYIGDAENFADLVEFWNLRATNVNLVFLDRKTLERFSALLPVWVNLVRELNEPHNFESGRGVGIWSRRASEVDVKGSQVEMIKAAAGTAPLVFFQTDEHSWNGLNLQAPMMYLGETDQLGVLATSADRPQLSFSLSEKPYSNHRWFYNQRLVASLSYVGGLYGDELFTLSVPYVPELNEFYGRDILYSHENFRVEPSRSGVVVRATDTDISLFALSVTNLFEQLFKLAGFDAQPSSAGLIARQLISQLGGLRGARVFKIPGVRRLLRAFGATHAFSADDAIAHIGRTDPNDGSTNFKEFQHLYIEPRKIGTELTARDVFAYLVAKGLFRVGASLDCPNCRMKFWIGISSLREAMTCEMCGKDFDARRQLMNGAAHFRRSGLLGVQRDAQGAVPVILALHQLADNFGATLSDGIYSPSLELTRLEDGARITREVDFVWLMDRGFPRKPALIVAECKDRGRSEQAITASLIDGKDIENLKAIADALPQRRLDVYVLLVKLSKFSDDEVKLAKTINQQFRQRAILLTESELEPRRFYARAPEALGIKQFALEPGDLAVATDRMYFQDSSNKR